MANKKSFMRKGENVAKRSKRYARELKSGKSEITGKPLTKGQRSFRGGVLNERSMVASQHNLKLDSAARATYGTCYAELNERQKKAIARAVK